MSDLSQRERELLAELAKLRLRIAREETKEFGSSTAIASTIHGATLDTTPLDADEVPGLDSSASFSLVRWTWTSIKAFFKTYFDTLYGLLATANSWTQNQTIASTQTTGNALRVIRNLDSASTAAAVVDLIQDHASDDQAVLRAQQDGTGNIFDFFDGATRVLRLVDGGRLDAYNIIRALTSSGLRFEDDAGNLGIELADGGIVSLHRVTTSTTLLRQSALLKITTSGAAADGFGPAFFFDFNDSDTSGSNPIGAIGAVRAGADNNGDLVFYTYLSGAGSEAARMTKDGRVVVGATVAAGKVHIDQSSTTAAIPVLVLDQADVSEPMIEFETTVGTGNSIEAKGAKALTTTHFLKVKLPDNSIAYIEMGTIA